MLRQYFQEKQNHIHAYR